MSLDIEEGDIRSLVSSSRRVADVSDISGRYQVGNGFSAQYFFFYSESDTLYVVKAPGYKSAADFMVSIGITQDPTAGGLFFRDLKDEFRIIPIQHNDSIKAPPVVSEEIIAKITPHLETIVGKYTNSTLQ